MLYESKNISSKYMNNKKSKWIVFIARTGLTAKGIVYCLIGFLAFMAAFHINGTTTKDAEKKGIFQVLLDQPFGKILLGILISGLVCFCIWRFLQAFIDTDYKGSNLKGWGKRFAYFFSGLGYLSISFFAFKLLTGSSDNSDGNKQNFIKVLLNITAGELIVGVIAAIITGIGVYQIYYGFSEKYKEHVDAQKLNHQASSTLLRAGKIGFISRGIVWLIIAIFFFKTAVYSNSNEVGSTGKAMDFIQDSPFGSYLLASLALGLICYGVFNFIRAAFEKFKY